MWVPRLGAIFGTSASEWSSSGRIRSAHTPVALTTLSARTTNVGPALAVAHGDPRFAPVVRAASSITWSRLAQIAPNRSASPSTVSTSRASSVWQS